LESIAIELEMAHRHRLIEQLLTNICNDLITTFPLRNVASFSISGGKKQARILKIGARKHLFHIRFSFTHAASGLNTPVKSDPGIHSK
jgi:hypothetical protein